MKPILFNFCYKQEDSPQNTETLFTKLLASGHFELGEADIRRFPDGESYVRVLTPCQQRNIIVLANLHRPDDKFLPLLFLCNALRNQQARQITLVAPYLPYMRQDKQFHDGECITSACFASLLSPAIDRLITIDPHLHRYSSLSEIYSVESTVLKADKTIAEWIKKNVDKPLIIGPDSESEQWAAATAKLIGCPHLVLSKERFGDRDVRITATQATDLLDHTPVLVDDIISTGRTMIETANVLKAEGFRAPICIGVHAVFSDSDFEALNNSYIEATITCNTITHMSNNIDISSHLLKAAIPIHPS